MVAIWYFTINCARQYGKTETSGMLKIKLKRTIQYSGYQCIIGLKICHAPTAILCISCTKILLWNDCKRDWKMTWVY